MRQSVSAMTIPSKLTISHAVRPGEQNSLVDVRLTYLPKNEDDNDYDPSDYRHLQHPIPSWMPYFSTMRLSFGCGLLFMPYAVSVCGLLLGPIIILCIGGVLIHTHLTLLWSLNEVSRRLRIPYVSFRYGFRLALLNGPPCMHWLGENGPSFIAWAVVFNQIGICTCIVIFTTDNLRDIADWANGKSAIYILLLPYVALVFVVSELRRDSYVNIFGFGLFLIAMGLIFYNILFVVPQAEAIPAITKNVSIMLAAAIILFNMSSVGMMLTMDKHLGNLKQMTAMPTGVVFFGLGIASIVSSVVGVIGYWKFGPLEANILRCLPYDEITTMLTIGLYSAAVMLAYPSHCYPALAIILEVIKNHDPILVPTDLSLRKIELLMLRPFFVLTTFAICYTMPFQGPLVLFVGGTSTAFLAIVCPALMELSLRYPDKYGWRNWRLSKDLTIVMWGLAVCICGIYLSFYQGSIHFFSLQSGNEEHNDKYVHWVY